MEEARRRGQGLLTSGLVVDVKAEVQSMAKFPLPPSQKYRHLKVEKMLKENVSGSNKAQVLESLSHLMKALNILEKYGCNLTSPTRPKCWRSVKYFNPVFRTTVDAIQGGRGVLILYGYTEQQSDGLGFPDDVAEPDRETVAMVTLEVMTLRSEIDMLIKGTHPHQEIFKDVVPHFVVQEDTMATDAAVIPPREDTSACKPAPPPLLPKPRLLGARDAQKPPSSSVQCNLCGGPATIVCPSCDSQSFCDACDDLFHRHPTRTNHKRDRGPKTMPLEICSICGVSSVHAQCATCVHALCLKCDDLFHSHPERKGHSRTVLAPAKINSVSMWTCVHCTTVNKSHDALCATCKRSVTTPNAAWQCKSCTVINQGSSILCEVCERPRLAPRPSIAPGPSIPGSGAGVQWTCQVCTFVNTLSTGACEVCGSAAKSSDGPPCPPKPSGDAKPQAVTPQPKPRVNLALKRQDRMREDGLKLIRQFKEAEKRGISPEEVYAALRVCDGSSVDPCDWQASELPHLLDEICAMAASVHMSVSAGGEGVKLSRAEAKLAWLQTGGDTERAVKQLLRDRQMKMRELQSLGFRDASQCEEALRQSAGEVKGALSVLQRPLLDAFHKRIWSEQPEPPLDPNHPDKERMCRRLLALYGLPSWGRCELTLSLLQEPGVAYSLEDVVQAVRASHDRDFIKRVLNNECPCCLSIFPRSKMQSLTSCQCSVCLECFTQHFTITVRDKHIRDMVCPICREPDINDPEQLDSYFSMLDIQLRECLEPDVYELFHRKLTDHALMKDPKFLWCSHCVSGFINEGDQLKVTCLSCCNSFCAQCKKPWEPQHQDQSCEQFQQWKRDNDVEYQRQGLAGYLRDNGITCPQCHFQYALTKGGCMHFSCSQCRYQFCSGCNNPYYKTGCRTEQCSFSGLHAHHPRDCLFYLRDWDAIRLQALLKRGGVAFNTEPSDELQTDTCGVMEQRDEGGQPADLPCGVQSQPGQAGLCEKHYREYLVSLINAHSLDPAPLYDSRELIRACERYQVDAKRPENEDDVAYHARLLTKLMEVPLGEKVPRNKRPRGRGREDPKNGTTSRGGQRACLGLACSEPMAPATPRSTRRLRSWIVEQVSSGKFPGLRWEDEAETMFRIPWKHAGKQDFRKDEDAAIFKAWAEFKGKLSESNPAVWKTRLRCALNKSPEFSEVLDRAQLDISEPYKVYRLVPVSEQGAQTLERKRGEKSGRKWKRRSSDAAAGQDVADANQMKTENEVQVQLHAKDIVQSAHFLPEAHPAQTDAPVQDAPLSEIRLDVRIEESVTPPQEDKDSLHIAVHYLGQKVLTRHIHGPDVRVLYVPSSSPVPPTPAPDVCFPRIHLPEPPPSLPDDRAALLSLLPFMEKGVALTSTQQGVYGRRFCRGRVFWTGPHTSSPGLRKMERNSEPVLLFSKDTFKQQLDDFRVNGGEPPQSSLTLCFGEELSGSEDPSGKFIIVQVRLPWAEQQVQSAHSIVESFTLLQSPLDEITLSLAVPTVEQAP
ncbi:E3 ubiquitin-protein ligase RNF31-like [Phyllopteryx taeniolatus]|uniref:E3 ubiquitin-protein ligase RNF31-like n=1 Tax=Phyllopteryx taeniolatus TaxID=161469 RepID=UPI002AD58F6F|nr:E3 ubiquitin-protein ligase RNF31-like [Phyllopteryx taeniolatus]